MKDQKGPFVVLEYPGGRGGGMTAARYKAQILEPFVKQFVLDMQKKRKRVWFQQDGAPSHTAKIISTWLKDNNIPLFPHPPKSPDFSPIEPVWFDLKNIIKAYPHQITSVEQLKDIVRSAWDKLTVDQINAHINRMPAMLDECIERNGSITSY